MNLLVGAALVSVGISMKPGAIGSADHSASWLSHHFVKKTPDCASTHSHEVRDTCVLSAWLHIALRSTVDEHMFKEEGVQLALCHGKSSQPNKRETLQELHHGAYRCGETSEQFEILRLMTDWTSCTA